MATLWVSTSGNNANDGLSYGQAKADIAGAISAASQGDTINVVNDGNHVMVAFVATVITFAGTDYDTDPGLLIQGTDSSGNPAIATAQSSGSNTYWTRIDHTANYITIRGIRFDYSTQATTTQGNLRPIYFRANTQNIRILDCEFQYTSGIGPGVTITNSNELVCFYFTGASSTYPAAELEVSRCVFINCGIRMPGITDLTHNVHHNVFIADAVFGYNPTHVILGAGDTTGLLHRYYNNTLIHIRYGTNTPPSHITCALDNTAILDVHSNLLFSECGSGVSGGATGMSGSRLQGSAVASQVAAVNEGYSVFALGAELTVRRTNWDATNGYGSYQFCEQYRGGGANDATLLTSTSSVQDDSTYANVFFATGMAWDWMPDIYTHSLPFDMRPTIGRTSALGGGVVGAVLDPTNLPPIITGNIGTFSVTASETLNVTAGDGPASVSSDPDLDTLTYGVIDNVTHGVLTFNTTTGAFAYQPVPTYAGPDSFTFKACDALTCTTVVTGTSDTPRALIDVTAIPSPPPTPGGDIDYPLVLDSLPFYAPVLKADAVASVRIDRNNTRGHVDFRHYLNDARWNEFTTRLVTLAGASSTTLNLGGVGGSQALMLETDQELSVTVVWNTTSGTDSFATDVTECLMLDQVEVSSLVVSNTSSVTANMHLSVFE